MIDDSEQPVPFVPVRCPKCKARKPRTYGQDRRVRYHACQECGHKFRSLEVGPDAVQGFSPAEPTDR